MGAAVGWAQESEPNFDGQQPLETDSATRDDGGISLPFTINAGGATCSEAALLSVPGGDSMDVSSAGTSDDEPTLSCMWGTPERPQGYRTVWYQFVAPHNGRVVISTRNSGYDTVLAVHTGTCDTLPSSLTTLACNDDTTGFTSEISLSVTKGQTYYVEVADWHQAVSDPSLQISILPEPLPSFWQQLDLMPVPLSRHGAITVNDKVLVLGGQDSNVFTGAPSNRLQRYNTSNDQWDDLAPMPGVTGYAHPAMTYIPYTNKIYVPSGVVNSYFVDGKLNQDVDDTHWIYTLPSANFPDGFWTEADPASWPDGNPWSWTTAVASLDIQKQGYYLIGGISSAVPLAVGAAAHSEMLFYSTFSHDWHDQAPMEVGGTAVPRYGHTAVWLNDKVCVTGGATVGSGGAVELLSQGMCFDPDTDTWSYIGAMNEPRYGASSDVGPDGRWYVFGGFGATGGTIATTEVYDPTTDRWTILNASHDLGQFSLQGFPPPVTLPRAWTQVKRVGDYFWAIGGEVGSTSSPLGTVERLLVAPHSLYLPFAAKADDGTNITYDNFAEARRLQFNVSQQHNFNNLLDFLDVFFIDVPSLRSVRFRLTQIPDQSNFDIAIYDENKLLWGQGQNLSGQDEDVSLTLPAGRYYIMVTRKFPLGDPNPDVFYKVKAEG